MHENFVVSAGIDQAAMTLWSVLVECLTCGAKAPALDDEVILGPWEEP